MKLPRYLSVIALGLVALLESSACLPIGDPLGAAAMLTRDSDGTLVVRPFICADENRIFDVSILDGSPYTNDGERNTQTVLWAARSSDPAGASVDRIRVGDASPGFQETEPLVTPPAERRGHYLTVRISEFFNGKRREFEDVADFDHVAVGRYNVASYDRVSEGTFYDLQGDLCGDYYGSPNVPRDVGIAVAFVLVVAVLAGLDARDRRRRRAAAARAGDAEA